MRGATPMSLHELVTQLCDRHPSWQGWLECMCLRAELLGIAPPLTDQLLGAVAANPYQGWYTNGAYIESVMKVTNRMRYRAVYGLEKGDELWAKYYEDAKARGGDVALAPIHGILPAPIHTSAARHRRRLTCPRGLTRSHPRPHTHPFVRFHRPRESLQHSRVGSLC